MNFNENEDFLKVLQKMEEEGFFEGPRTKASVDTVKSLLRVIRSVYEQEKKS